jgi:uncharacterized RDD family membrane protein YckC
LDQAISAPAASAIQTASLWWRTRATILDLLIIGLLQALINMTFGAERITNAVVGPSTSGGFSSFTSTTAVDGFWLYVTAFAYYALLEGLFGQTLGKAAVGIRVTGLDGRQASVWQILVRNLLRVIDWLPLFYFLGALVARVSGGRQRIGDHLAGTFVVPAAAASGEWPSAEQRRQRKWMVAGLVALLLVVCGAFSYFGRPAIVLGNVAAEGQFPGGRVTNYQHGAARWHDGSVTYPVTYTQSSGTNCSGSITLDWHGFLQGWQMSTAESNC